MEMVETLEKIKVIKNLSNEPIASSGCCGGAPVSNTEACCILDEEKKAEGEAGCGCGTSEVSTSKSSCC